MEITLLKSKIHRATVTDSNVAYEGSITIDENLLEAVGICLYEKVLVGNITNGSRFETYAIKGKKGSGIVCLNGATAHLGKIGDILTIFTFAQVTEEEISSHKPRMIRLDKANQIIHKK